MADFLTTLPVFSLMFLIASRYIRRFSARERLLLWLSFFAHQAAAVANILVTQYYYEFGDMLTYHVFGVLAADRLRADFFSVAPSLVRLLLQQPDVVAIPLGTMAGSTGSVQAISAFAMFGLNDSLYAVCSLIAGGAFLSKLALYQVTRVELPDVDPTKLLWAVMLVPSVVFWSSALLKEPIAMIGLLSAIYAMHQFVVYRRRLRGLLIAAVALPFVMITKAYLFPVLALAAGCWYVLRSARNRQHDVVIKTGHLLITAVAVAVAVLGTGALLPRFAMDALDDEFARLQTVGANLNAGTTYTLGGHSGDAASQVALAPLGLLTALFRPMLFEVKSPLVLASALETFVFTLGTLAVLTRRSPARNMAAIMQRPFLMFCVLFVVCFGTCAGLGATNLGTLSRYRMPLIPFFAIALTTLLSRQLLPSTRHATEQASRPRPTLKNSNIGSRHAAQ